MATVINAMGFRVVVPFKSGLLHVLFTSVINSTRKGSWLAREEPGEQGWDSSE